jgi:hypothetical protein
VLGELLFLLEYRNESARTLTVFEGDSAETFIVTPQTLLTFKGEAVALDGLRGKYAVVGQPRTQRTLVANTLTALDLTLRLGSGEGFAQRYLREAMAEAPEVAGLRAWVGGELKRGYSRDLAAAGRALSNFDARPFAASVNIPCATVVTTRDHLVRPQKQYQLTEALGAELFEVDGGHDAPLVRSKHFASAVGEAVAGVSDLM